MYRYRNLAYFAVSKTKADHIDALEVQKESVEMARRSIILNELSNRITIYEGDVKTASDQFGKNCYDAVTVNPPYMNQGHGLKNPNMPMAIARHEILCTLEDVIRESANLLKTQRAFLHGSPPISACRNLCYHE